MVKTKKFGSKGGCKLRRTRPEGISRKGLPKTYPSHINPCVRAAKIG